MKKKTLLDLEDFIYEFYGEENIEISVAVLTTILGVFAGVKPAGLLKRCYKKWESAAGRRQICGFFK